MVDTEVQERIAVRRAELDDLEEQLVKQLTKVRAEREDLAAAERVPARTGERIAVERAAAAPVAAQAGGKGVLLVPHRAPEMDRRAGQLRRDRRQHPHPRPVRDSKRPTGPLITLAPTPGAPSSPT